MLGGSGQVKLYTAQPITCPSDTIHPLNSALEFNIGKSNISYLFLLTSFSKLVCHGAVGDMVTSEAELYQLIICT